MNADMTEKDVAYLAGFFDGEGCVGYYNANPNPEGTPYFHVSINISNTDPRPILWMQKLLGFGKAKSANVSGKRRQAYQWQISKRSDVKTFLELVRPYLIVKAEQADVILALFEMEKDYTGKHGSVTPEVTARRREAAAKVKALKREFFAEGVETEQAGPSIH